MRIPRLAMLLALMAVALAPLRAEAQLRTVNVSSNNSLSTALASALPGDAIVLADGNYAGFTITQSGTAANPIIIHAANQNKAVVTSSIIKFSAVNYVTVQGLKITTPGSSQSIDGDTLSVAVWMQDTNNSQVSRCTISLNNPGSSVHFVLLGGNSNSNRIDHCDLGPNKKGNAKYVWPRGKVTIAGVTPPTDRTSWANGQGPVNPNMARNTRIDHNYFHDKASGTGEAIVTGGMGITGDYQDTFTTIESNLFENCDGDAEIISVKSSSNFIRFNTFRTSGGLVSLRAGNKSTINGNFFFQGTKSGAGGIKIYEKDHNVYNNYIQDGTEYPMLVGGGDAYTDNANFSHAQVFRAKILHNTIVNPGRQFRVGHGGVLVPTDCVIANNLITDSSGTPFLEAEVPVNMTYVSNVIWPTGPSGKTSSQFTVTNPLLVTVNGMKKLPATTSPAKNAANQTWKAIVTTDMDGEARNTATAGLSDIGADEYYIAAVPTVYPLSANQVGPYADLPRTAVRPPIRTPLAP